MFMDVLSIAISIFHIPTWCSSGPEECVGPPGTDVTEDYEPLYG